METSTSLVTDLPKPFFRLLLLLLDEESKLRLRCVCKESRVLVDEHASLLCWIRGESSTPPLTQKLQLLGDLSCGIRTLGLPEYVRDFPLLRDPMAVPILGAQAFHKLEHLVINYRLSHVCQVLAAAAGSSLSSITIVKGRRKGSRWQLKLCKLLQNLKTLPSLRSLHLTLHSTPQSAQILGQLTQLQSLKLSITKAPGDSSSHPEHLFDCQLANLALTGLTGLTSLVVNLPVVVQGHLWRGQLPLPAGLQRLQLQLQYSDVDMEVVGGGATGIAAAQQLLHNFPLLPQLTQLVVKAHSPNDWFSSADLRLSNRATERLGQLHNLRSLDLSVGHWQLSLLQLQPLSACCHLTELVVPELVMGYANEGVDDQMWHRLSQEEAAAVAAGIEAAAAAARCGSSSGGGGGGGGGTAAGCKQQLQDGSRGGSSGGRSTMTVLGHVVCVPLLPQLKVLRCCTLWWRLPVVVLAPCLDELAYKRLRNLGYESFVLPDLQAQDGGGIEAGINGLLGAFLAPQGGFAAQQQQQQPMAAVEMLAAAVAGVVEGAAAEAAAEAAAGADDDGAAGQVANEMHVLGELIHQEFVHLQEADHHHHQQQQQQQQEEVLDELPVWDWLIPEGLLEELLAPHDGMAAAGPVAPAAAAPAAPAAAAPAPAAAIPAAAVVEEADLQDDGMAAAGPAAADVAEDEPAAAEGQHAPASPVELPTPPAAPPLQDAPVSMAYGDVLRGQRCLRVLDVCVTALCKVMRLSSRPLAGLQQLRLHMLGEVKLAPGGLPLLPGLTQLEFYLPDERNWDADYNDYEDIALWQNQANVRQVVIRGTFHAGGFFAPGHLDVARRAMPQLQLFHFINCPDLHTDKLQQVIDSKVAPRVVVEACGCKKGAAAAAAEEEDGSGSSSDGEGSSSSSASVADGGSIAAAGAAQQEAGSSAAVTGSSSKGLEEILVLGDDEVDDQVQLSDQMGRLGAVGQPMLVTKGAVQMMSAAAAAAGIQLVWIGAPQPWRELISDTL